jgi:hypothetical protein
MGIKPVNKRSVSKTTTKELTPEQRYRMKQLELKNKEQSSTPKRIPQQRLTTTTTKRIIAPLTPRTKPKRPNSY